MSRRDIREDERPIGGDLVLRGGDIRQIPPIARRGRRANVLAYSTKRSPIWRTTRMRVLTRNLRLLDGAGEFSDYMIKIGEGSVEIVGRSGAIDPPSEICAGDPLLVDPFAAIGRQVVPDIGRRCMVMQSTYCRAMFFL